MQRIATIKILLVFFITTSLTFYGFSKTEIVTSKWPAYELNIDGNQIDWRDHILSSEKRLSVDYAFKNDGENLFIIFIFNDSRYLSTISATGMTIWFNIEGTKKKEYGIQFTKKQISAESFITYLEKKRGPLSEEEKNNLRAKQSYFLHTARVITSKKDQVTQSPPDEESQKAVFRATRQRELTVYEFAIPLKKEAEKDFGVGSEPGKIIKICFEWGGMTDEMKAAKIRSMQGASGGTPEKPVVSADTWVKSVGEEMPQASASPKHSFWVDVQLARNQ